MPFFFLLPLWALCLICGAVLAFFPRSRFLSTYVLLASTFAILLAFLLSTAVLLLAGRVVGGTDFAWLALIAYVAAIGVGGIGGAIAGLFLAHRANRRFGWKP
jgi:hypothetical protein